MAKKISKYPDLIYIEIDYDKDTPYFVAHSTPNQAASLDDIKEVAVYRLVKTAKVRTKIEVA